jgi:hypothetical protein
MPSGATRSGVSLMRGERPQAKLGTTLKVVDLVALERRAVFDYPLTKRNLARNLGEGQ